MMIAINVDVLVIGIPEVGSIYAVDENNERKIKMNYLEGMNDGESAGILENDRKGESNEILEKKKTIFSNSFPISAPKKVVQVVRSLKLRCNLLNRREWLYVRHKMEIWL